MTQQRQNRMLLLGQVAAGFSIRQGVGMPKTHSHAIAMFLNFWTGQAGGPGQIHHPDRATAPFLNDAASVECARNQWIPGP